MKLFARFRYEGATAKDFWFIEKGTTVKHCSLLHNRVAAVANLTPTTATSFQLNAAYDVNHNNTFISKDLVAQSIKEALNGFNFALLVSGYTGSGKTHTMMGGGGEEGLIQLAANEIFRLADEDKQRRYTVKCLFTEYYIQQVYDLLSEDKGVNLVGRTGKPVMPQPTVVENAEDVRGLLQKAHAARKTSSRSHVMFQIVIDSSPIGGPTAVEPTKTATVTFGNLN